MTKKKAQELAKKILYSNEIDTPLKDDNLNYMMDYFNKYHLDWRQKVGVGILAIYTIIEPRYKRFRAFKIVRIDSSETDISYIISNINKRNYKRDFKTALRNAISSQISGFRQEQFKDKQFLICPLSGEMVKFEDSHVDHESPTFNEIAESFIERYDITDFKDYLVPHGDNHITEELAFTEMRNDFCRDHEKQANLRILSAIGNLSLAKK